MVHPPRPAAIAPPQTEPPWTGGLFRPGETPPALAGGEDCEEEAPTSGDA